MALIGMKKRRFGCGQVLLVVGAVVLVLAVAVGIASWSMSGSPVPLNKVDDVAAAASMDEVEAMLGRPSRALAGAPGGGCTWVYSRPFLWHEFRVAFAPDGTVLSCRFED